EPRTRASGGAVYTRLPLTERVPLQSPREPPRRLVEAEGAVGGVGVRAVPGARDLDEVAAVFATPSLELGDQVAGDAAAPVRGTDGDRSQAQAAGPVLEERDDRGA